MDRLLAPEILEAIVNVLANGEFCANSGDDRCPGFVLTLILINIGLPMIIAEASDVIGSAQVVFPLAEYI